MADWTSPSSHSGAEDDDFRGRIGRLRQSGGTRGALGARLTKALKGGAPKSFAASRAALRPLAGDSRQRVVAKVSFHNHGFGGGAGGGSGGGGKLIAHAQYLERDGAGRELDNGEVERGQFYDREQDVADDARARLQDWSLEDKRHFRLMLAPESGARIVGIDGDLREFTRETMARVERDLGVKLDWLAVDHHNTHNPHTHVILRGVRRDGVDLLLPREYVAHGLREAARGVATQILGERGRADERLRLDREIEGRSLNRLDRQLEQELNSKREVRLQSLGRDGGPELGDALRARARELERMGLAQEVRRNVVRFEPDWVERLEAARPLDIRRALTQARLYEKPMGRVVGEVKELGSRGDNPDRALLVLETPNNGRLLINTGIREIEGLERGSLAALTPRGRGGGIEVISARSLESQIQARADTLLDRELDARARGQTRLLPALKGVEAALDARARWLEREGLGLRSDSGKFYFRDGARETLRAAELDREGLAQAKARGGQYRDLMHDPPHENEVWQVREVKELFAGRTAVLSWGRDIALAPLKAGKELNVGDRIGLRVNDPSRQHALEIIPPHELARTLAKGLSRGLDLSR